MLVFNAVKVYDEVKGEYDADYAMVKPVAGDGKAPVVGVSTDVVPRLFKTNIGDIFTTNTVKDVIDANLVGKVLYVGADGYLTSSEASASAMQWQVIKFYTMPDGQRGVKIMRIA
jgi:hypothetical protein